MVKRKIDCRSPEFLSATAALISGVIAHSFALVNLIHNYDDILQYPKGYGAGITSGRWFLEVLGDLNDAFLELNYNLPVMNGLGFLVLIALSSAVIVNFLKIRRASSAVLLGCLMVTFPTVCATMVFRYTAPYYGLSLLLSVLAAWVIDKHKCGVLISALLTALSMGIYQAYVPFTIGLLVLILLRDSLEENAKLAQLIRRGVVSCISLALGVGLYFVFLKIAAFFYSGTGEAVLDDYQGVSTMGQISLRELPYLIKKAWVSAALFPIRDYCELAAIRPLKVLWLVLVGVILVQVGYIIVRKRTRLLLVAFCGLMGLLFPIAINFITIMVPDGLIYTIMVYSFVLVGCVPLALWECMPAEQEKGRRVFAQAIGILLSGIVLYNGYYANVNYTALYYSNRQVENFVNSLRIQARVLDGYSKDKKWVFVGEVGKFTLYDMWYEVPYYGGISNCTASELFNTTYSRDNWFGLYLGNGTVHASQEEELAVKEDARVKRMPCWPEAGSIQVIDDYVVVKFQD